jgi:hypothetical protein
MGHPVIPVELLRPASPSSSKGQEARERRLKSTGEEQGGPPGWMLAREAT